MLAVDRFALLADGPGMQAVVTLGHGGYEQLRVCQVPIPAPGPGEVLLQVLAAGVNNTEINTRLGWYSAGVALDTGAAAAAAQAGVGAGDEAGATGLAVAADDGGWSEATPFPFIQGTDCCGRIVAVGPGADASRVGQRVLVRPCMRRAGFVSMDTGWMGSDFDGAFAQFVKVPAAEAFVVQSQWSDAELASMPCSWGTALNMLLRAGVGAGDHVLVAGASGGVGSAAVQLARVRGASVTAIATSDKHAQVLAMGATRVLDRAADVVASLGRRSVDVVVDNVAGAAFGSLLQVLRRGGRYVSSGAIAGPLVTLDMRSMYLNDLQLLGCTAWDEPVFTTLLGHIERDEVRPLVARTFDLADIAQAQALFLQKRHVGNFVLLPAPLTALAQMASGSRPLRNTGSETLP